MKILHITSFHSSLSTGGTELYIEGLKSAFTAVFAAINKVAVISHEKPSQIPGDVDFVFPDSESKNCISVFRQQISKLLDDFRPDFAIIHTAVNHEGLVAEELITSNIPYIFILHAVSWLCYQQNRLYSCQTPCHVMFKPFRCSVCRWKGKGHAGISWSKVVLGEVLRRIGICRTSRYFELKREQERKEYVVRQATACIALNQRDYDCLGKNNIRPERLHLLPTALAEDVLDICRNNARKPRNGILKILCAGRFTEVKGTLILVKAANSLPENIQFQLDFFGAQMADQYTQEGLLLAKGDKRINIYPMLSHDQILQKYAEYDIQCLPSTVFDNGPLALWEGAYSGCLIVSSENIGQKAFVSKYGYIVAPNNPESWAAYIQCCVANLSELRSQRIEKFPEYSSMNAIAKHLHGFVQS